MVAIMVMDSGTTITDMGGVEAPVCSRGTGAVELPSSCEHRDAVEGGATVRNSFELRAVHYSLGLA